MKAAALLFAVIVIVWCAVAALRKPAHGQDCQFGAFGCGHADQHHEYEGLQAEPARAV